jgi:hypothetical protein
VAEFRSTGLAREAGAATRDRRRCLSPAGDVDAVAVGGPGGEVHLVEVGVGRRPARGRNQVGHPRAGLETHEAGPDNRPGDVDDQHARRLGCGRGGVGPWEVQSRRRRSVPKKQEGGQHERHGDGADADQHRRRNPPEARETLAPVRLRAEEIGHGTLPGHVDCPGEAAASP